MKKDYTIECDACGYQFKFGDIKTTTKYGVKVEDKTFDITYFKCEKCGKVYIVEMLDYMAQKKKNRYLAVMASMEKKRHHNTKISEQRIAEAIQLKDDAIGYQKWLVDKYQSVIPQGTFED